MLTYPDMIAILSNMTQNNFNLLQLDEEAKNEAQCKGRSSVGAQDARPPFEIFKGCTGIFENFYFITRINFIVTNVKF